MVITDVMILYICSKQELWSEKRQPLLEYGSVNTSIARQGMSQQQQRNHGSGVLCVVLAKAL
jgi:hypothetical protein